MTLRSSFIAMCFFITYFGCGIFGARAFADSEVSAHPVPQFSSDPDRVVHEGYFDLLWGLPPKSEEEQNWQFSLEMARDQIFSDSELIYSGSDRGTYFSGLGDGDYFFRVRARGPDSRNQTSWSDWSQIQHVQVEHHSLALAWWLFAAGGIIFSSICIFLFRAANLRGEL